jgi:ABC-type nitrate/sulfonate/bicarbonate transport system substrate-binding protein
MKNKKLMTTILALGAFATLAACKPSTTSTPTSSGVTDYGTVRLGLQGNFGASAGFVGISEGYFKAQGLTATSSITSGPNIITGLQGGTLDIGFLGNGVAWNYFLKENAPIKMLTIDNLTNDDRMIASKTGKGKTLSEASSNDDLYAALKNASVALDYARTPGSFLQSLVDVLNSGKDAASQLWYKVPGASETYPSTASQTAAFEVTLINTDNSSVTASMVSASAPDFCVTFSPVSTALTTLGFPLVATTLKRLGDTKLTPSTWAVSTSYLTAHPDAVKAFLRGLMKSFDLRHDNPSKASSDTAEANKFDGTYDTSIAYWPSSSDINSYFSTDTGKGMQYVNQIRASQVSKSQLAGGALESKDVLIDRTWITDACAAVAAK